jgi:hypothetical protein
MQKYAMKGITKKKTKFIIISFLIGFLSASFINKQLPILDFGDFMKKSYYEKLFTSKEVRKLNNASETIKDAKAELKEADKLFAKARVFNKIKKDARDKRDQRRADRKEQRYLRKAYRTSLGAFDDMFEEREYIYYTYDQRIRKFNNDSSNYHRFAEQYASKSREVYTQSIAKKRAADKFEDQEKHKAFEKIAELNEKAIKYQELALGMFMKDEKIDLSELIKEQEKQKEEPDDKEQKDDKRTDKEEQPDKKEKEKDKAKLDSTHTIVYNPETDPNLYKPLTDSIIPKLNINKTDSILLSKAYAKENRAKEYMDAVAYRYKRIDTLLSKIQTEKDRMKKELLKQDAAEIEKEVFQDLVAAANLYLEANDIKYEIYSKYFPKARPTADAGKLSKGKSYEESAKELKLLSTSSAASANLQMYVSEKYLQLMNAVQLQLSALQEQENAYAVYFGWPVTPLKKTFKIKYYADTDIGEKDSDKQEKTKDEDSKDKDTIASAEKYSYNYAGSYYYTKQNPKPQKLKPASGNIFKVQVGIFKRLLSLDTFGDFSPISYDEFTNNPFKRFMVGEYRSKEAAEYALKTIKEMGIDDAFIVAYKDGKRQTYQSAADKIKEDAEYKKTAQKELAALKDVKKSQNSGTLSYPDFITYGSGPQDFARSTDISNTQGLKYTVQIGLYKLPKTNDELKNISPLYREVTDKGVKYLAGIFNSYEAAKSQENKMKELGFKQAFVSAYHNGEHISLSKAKNYSKSSEKNSSMQPNVYYSVQIGAYSSLLPPEKEREFNSLSERYTISAKNCPNGLIIYTIGQFLRYDDAKAFSKTLKSKHPDVFVVAFKNEKKITVQEAIKITEK